MTPPRHATRVRSPTWPLRRIGRSTAAPARTPPQCGLAAGYMRGNPKLFRISRWARPVRRRIGKGSFGAHRRSARRFQRAGAALFVGFLSGCGLRGQGARRKCGAGARHFCSDDRAEMRWRTRVVAACRWLMMRAPPPIGCVGHGMDSPRAVVVDARPSNGLFWMKGRQDGGCRGSDCKK